MRKIFTTLNKIALTTVAAFGLSATANAQVTQLIVDGGMEGAAAAWTQASTNFGTPLCTAAACGLGGGTGPHAGASWCWFGGLGGAVEQASIEQSVTIPTGLVSADLSFWLELPVCDTVGGLQDFMVLTIDADTLFFVTGNDVLCGTIGYGQQTFNVLPYADGNSHIIAFNSTTFGTGGPTNFFVDDVSLLADNGAGPGPDCADTLSFAIATAIPDDDPVGATDVQAVAGLTGTLGSTISLIGVQLNVTHTWVGDLIFTVTAPNGQAITLIDRPGFPVAAAGCQGDDLDMEIIRGTGNEAENVCANLPAISGSFTAFNGTDLNAINTAGGSPNGNWTLSFSDNAAQDVGTVNSWSLVFSAGPVASWTAPSAVCVSGGVIDLTTLITGTTGGTWSGNGVTGTNFDPTGLSTATITYSVTDGNGCSDTQTSTILVSAAAPVASFSTSSAANTVTFANTSTNGGTYVWDFGDATTSTDTNTVHTYAATGTYTVSLTATNACGTNSTSQTVTLGCADVILDGSFEVGSPSTDWTEFSLNFGTPLCTAAGCGVGGGTGPNTGSWWAWFGGFPGGVEQGSVSQTVTIAANATSADLNFLTEYPVCDSAAGGIDVFFVTLGADTVYQTNSSDVDCGVIGYQARSFSVLSAADGLPHSLEFNSTTFGTNSATNFMVDDVALVVCTPVGISEIISGASVTVQPNPASDYIDISLSQMKENINVVITDAQGKTVYSKNIASTQKVTRVDVSKWSNGLYFVNFKAFGKNYSQKIVVE